MGSRAINFSDFNKFFFKDVSGNADISWFDKKGVIRIGDSVLAEITLSISGTIDHYVGYSVRIVNKSGELTKYFFNFNTYLKNRCDDRTDYRNGFEIIATCCDDVAQWYIAIPTEEDTQKMGEEIMKFIGNYSILDEIDE